MTPSKSGGCQCGAVRYSTEVQADTAHLCNCRMCQKAFGGFYGPLVTAHGLVWTRGERQIFASSDKVKRGFCGVCGTPFTYDYGGPLEVAIGSLDRPEDAAPVLQVNAADKLSFTDGLHDLPFRDDAPGSPAFEFLQSVQNLQHPDHDTDRWPQP